MLPLRSKKTCQCFVLIVAALSAVLGSLHEGDDEQYKTYNGYSLVIAQADFQSQINQLRSIIDHELPEVQVWKEPREHLGHVDLFVSRDDLTRVLNVLHQHNITYSLIKDHVHGLIDAHRRVRRSSSSERVTHEGFDLSEYHTYDEIMDWLEVRGRECGDMCQIKDIGRSYENRVLRTISIGDRTRNKKPLIWLDGGIHAREWIAPATALCIIDKLLDKENADAQFMLSRFNFEILPLINVDGYSYTWTKDRLWRKTRSVIPRSACRGVDPNRNWSYKWGGQGASSNPCSESYRGPRSFSEPETLAMAQHVLNLTQFNRVPLYLSLHSYGQYFLTSWGYSAQEFPPDYQELISVAKQATQSIKSVHGSVYQYGSAGNLLYPAAGGSDDWAKGVAGIKYSYTIELRDVDMYGFLLPSDQIRPTCEETMAGIKSLVRAVSRAQRRLRKKLRNRRHRH